MATEPQLKTRKPTGNVAYPLILVEGIDKTGKTFAALSLSASKKVGRTFVLELDEPTADEYASLGDFEILEHNGTYGSMLDQLRAATSVPMEGDRPNLIVLDTGTALWGLLKDWASSRAKQSRKGRKLLAEDPDAEVDVPMNLWNDSIDRWYDVVNLLRRWPGIAVMICRGKEVAKVINGTPVAGQIDDSVEAHKSIAFEVNAHVRMTRPHQATLMSARSLQRDIPLAGIPLDDAAPLEHLVFRVLGAGGTFAVPNLVTTSVGKSIAQAKNDLVAIFARSITDEQKQRSEAAAIWAKAEIDGAEINDQQWETLTKLAAERIANLLIVKDAPETKPAESGAVAEQKVAAEEPPAEKGAFTFPLNQPDARKHLRAIFVPFFAEDTASIKDEADDVWHESGYAENANINEEEWQVLKLMAEKRLNEIKSGVVA